ncbi:MAG: pantetheine-phosphate adenylyltransferase [Lachnospiraceae bacterium]|nr:pantetheine-phosphate adenylyltransferase [Lachnospiraceae bacterium]MDD7077629.1 pantetheine-phosphate adenylyltransferase [Lachnospiraceae bacterium]MDY3730071.1 pantetheine-phosphate adenylyltransferase [Candidatus Choladocola sp.]
MKRAVYPGSFDPVTKGHLDIIERAATIVDELVVGVLNNNVKTPLFSVEERVNMLIDVTRHIPNVRVEAFSGLSVEFVKKCNASFIVRGLRAVTDFEYELQMAQTNRSIDREVDTLFLTTALNYAYISSTIVKEVASYGGDISGFVPPSVVEQVYHKIEQKKQ